MCPRQEKTSIPVNKKLFSKLIFSLYKSKPNTDEQPRPLFGCFGMRQQALFESNGLEIILNFTVCITSNGM